MSFATTYALGEAAAFYLGRKRSGGTTDAAGVLAAYQDALATAFNLAKARDVAPRPGPADATTGREGKTR